METNPRIIYVEDNLNNQRLFARMLASYDVDIEFHDDIEKGYRAIVRQKPDLIFLDVHLKSRNSGLDLAKKLRETGITIPIVIVTAFPAPGGKKQAMEFGCDDYLGKPYSLKELCTIIDRFLPGSRRDVVMEPAPTL